MNVCCAYSIRGPNESQVPVSRLYIRLNSAFVPNVGEAAANEVISQLIFFQWVRAESQKESPTTNSTWLGIVPGCLRSACQWL